MSRLFSLGASLFTSIFAILFVVGAATWANPAVGDEPLVNGCGDFVDCGKYDPDDHCWYDGQPVACDLICDCQVVSSDGGENCQCKPNAP
jgi:hypothetical protein